jgi:hypothetical protein
MSLIVTFQNISELSPESDYKVDVFINKRHIAGSYYVNCHFREDGWFALVEKFVKDYRKIIT